MFPPIIGYYYSPMLPWFLAPLVWVAGLACLWGTRYTTRGYQKWGRRYYLISGMLRPLGIILISWGWLEVMGDHYGELISSGGNSLMISAVFGLMIILYLIAMLTLAVLLFRGLVFILAAIAIIGSIVLIPAFGHDLIKDPLFMVTAIFWWAFLFGAWSIFSLGVRRSLLYRDVYDPLVIDGPYGVVRHPQLLAAIIMVVCTCVPLSIPFGMIGSTGFYVISNALVFIALLMKVIASEETDLIQDPGISYPSYARHIPQILPHLLSVRFALCHGCGRLMKTNDLMCPHCSEQGRVVLFKSKGILKYFLLLFPPALLITLVCDHFDLVPYGVKDNYRAANGRAESGLAVMRLRIEDARLHEAPVYVKMLQGEEIQLDEILGNSSEYFYHSKNVVYCVTGRPYFRAPEKVETDYWNIRKASDLEQYGRQACPFLSFTGSDGFQIALIGNFDFDSAYHILIADQTGTLFTVYDDAIRSANSPPPPKLSFMPKTPRQWDTWAERAVKRESNEMHYDQQRKQ